MTTKKLARLIKKAYGTEDLGGRLGPHWTPELKSLMDSIDSALAQDEELIEIANRNLETTSRELNERNRTLERLNQGFRAVMNSLEQGFFVFDRDGICLPIRSSACESLIEVDPAGHPIAEVLRVPERSHEEFTQWTQFLFDEIIDFEDLAILGPPTFPHSQGRFITLEYRPMRSDRFGAGEDRYKGQTIEGIVVVATDRTQEREARAQAEEKDQYAQRIIKITRDRNAFLRLVRDTRGMIGAMREGGFATNASETTRLRMLLHTIKGAAAAFSISSLRDLANEQETELDSWLKLDGDTAQRVALQKRIAIFASQFEQTLDDILAQHRDLLGVDFERAGYKTQVRLDELRAFSAELSRMPESSSLQKRFLESIASVPLEDLFFQFDSVLRDTAQSLGKQVHPLVIESDGVRVMPDSYLDVVTELVHVFRNAADHALELPDERKLKGKSPIGQVKVKLQKRSPNGVIITISDDGRGVDPSKIRSQLPGSQNESDHEVIQHIFDDGYSTSETINELSGRGVGLAALKTATARLGGKVEVFSTLGQGSEFRIALPEPALKSIGRSGPR